MYWYILNLSLSSVVWALQHTQYLSQSAPLPGMKQNLITPPSSSSSSSQTQPAPLCDHISLFPPLQSYSLQMGVTNMLGQVQQRITCCYYIRAQTNFTSQEVRQDSQTVVVTEREVKWRRKEFSWTGKPSLVPSVWIYWRIRWLLPVDTATAWTVLKATGMKRIVSTSTAALSAGRRSHRGLSCWKTPC